MDQRPKGRVTSYAKFVSDTRVEQKAEGRNPDNSNRDFSFGYLLNESAAKWRNMEPSDRQPYYDHAAQDRARYQSEWNQYHQNNGGYN